MENTTKSKAANFSKPLYAGFVLLGCYFLFTKDFAQATSFLGLALIFDPFDPKITFKLRPPYQQIWLIVHLAIVFGVFGIMLIGK